MSFLRRKLTLQQLTKASDGTGGTSAVWSTIKNIFGEMSVESGKRIFVNGQEYSDSVYTVKVRYQSLNYSVPVENYRLILDAFGINTTLKILTVTNPDMIKMFAVLTCIGTDGK